MGQHPSAFLPLAGFLTIGFVALLLLQRGWSRAMVWSILAVIILYVWLKKYTFLPEESFLRFPYFTLGLSYIFFRVLHLLIEAGDRTMERNIGVGEYLLYTLNFTTFISGPIQRYDEFARDQFSPEPLPLGPRVIGLQLERIVLGFFKINVLGAVLYSLEQDALVQTAQPLPLTLKLFAVFRLIIISPFFVYANFSGYIDIVIALARLMRLRLPENFDRPFSATSFLDFWNRWHITLSNWVKNYVYNPLLMALMRRISSTALEPFLAVFCFFVTFFLVGVWHGRSSEFLFFGVLLGLGISINKLWQVLLARAMGGKNYKSLARNSAYRAFGRGLTFTWFALTNIWFWLDWKQIDSVFADLGFVQWVIVWSAVCLGATVALEGWEHLRRAVLAIKTSDGPVLTSRYVRVVYSSALGLLAIAITVLLNQPAPEIIYKAF
jgi:D-alanyl-lipoteichoic acid acyltransferase DltB (MBOAT superfamily)